MKILNKKLSNICFVTWIVSAVVILNVWLELKTFTSFLYLGVLCFIGGLLLTVYSKEINKRKDINYFTANKYSNEDLKSNFKIFHSMAFYSLCITIGFSLITFDQKDIFPLSLNGLIAFSIGASFQTLTYIYSDKRWFVDEGRYIKNSMVSIGVFHFFVFSVSQVFFYLLFI